MTINNNLLIAAPVLQDLLVDKDGTPMAGGTITCYHDDSRTTLKNWYYQIGAGAPYQYIPLPNPLTLSAAGTICDINGVDTIPFFYPYDETNEAISDSYYITIVNHAQTNQITRQNFPFITQSSGTVSGGIEFNNLIINGGFWRNSLPNYLNVTPYQSITLSASQTVAPSQHDGFTMPDIMFLKTNTSGTDTLTFTPFPAIDKTVILNTSSPEYYINHVCSNIGSSVSQKCYQFPIALHLQNLANQPFTVTIQAQNAGTGTGTANQISLYLYQFTGTGTSSPVSMLIANTSLTLTPNWATYPLSDIFPDTTGLTLSQAEDDAFYLQVQMPLSVTCNINFTKPSLYLTTNSFPANDFQTYDQVSSIISSPRTGDIRTSMNSFYRFGWLPMNDGFIALNNPNNARATYANAETWQLYNLIWSLGKTYDVGGMSPFNAISPMYTNAFSLTAVNYGMNAYADFIAGNKLTLSQIMGQVILGTVPIPAMIGGTTVQTVTITNNGGNLLFTGTNGTYFFNGQAVAFVVGGGGALPSNMQTNAVYYVANAGVVSSLTFNVATTYANAIAGTVLAYASGYMATVNVNTDIPGAAIGEYGHLQALTEVANHSHVPGFGLTSFLGAGSTSPALGSGSGIGSAPTTGLIYNQPGANVPANIVQPATFFNMYIKL